MISQVVADPFIPFVWGRNQPGMQAAAELDGDAHAECVSTWLNARDRAVTCARKLVDLGLHKQISNRLLEPWMWTESIFTATEFGNFFALRCHPAAEPHMQMLANAMLTTYKESVPELLDDGEWHLPYVFGPNHSRTAFVPPYDKTLLLKYSVARCARVSYLNHDGSHPDSDADVALFDKLLEAGHMSPMEHQGMAVSANHAWERSGNFFGFTQFRKTIEGENKTHPAVLEWQENEYAARWRRITDHVEVSK
jgi:hypothetical protein